MVKRVRSSGTYELFLSIFSSKVAKKPFTIVGNGRQKEILPTFQT